MGPKRFGAGPNWLESFEKKFLFDLNPLLNLLFCIVFLGPSPVFVA